MTDLTLREVLGIARREFHDNIVDLMKRKRLATEPEPEKPFEVRAAFLEEMAAEDDLAESQYTWPHWARATTETPSRRHNPTRFRARDILPPCHPWRTIHHGG